MPEDTIIEISKRYTECDDTYYINIKDAYYLDYSASVKWVFSFSRCDVCKIRAGV